MSLYRKESASDSIARTASHNSTISNRSAFSESSSTIIMVIGSLNMDLITRTPRIPGPGETMTASSISTGSGGKGANQAVACARLSRTKKKAQIQARLGPSAGSFVVKMVGAVGDDIFGKELREGLKKDGVDVNGVRVVRGEKTGVANVIVEEGGENRIMLNAGANATVKEDVFTGLDSVLPEVIVMQLEIPQETVLRILETACSLKVSVVFNPAPAVELPLQAFAMVTHLIVNESEAAILTGKSEDDMQDMDNVKAAAKTFLDRGVKNVVVTLGGKGAYYASRGGLSGTASPEKVAVVDTTAAGDTFVGAYAIEVARAGSDYFDIQTAVAWSNRAAARTVEKEGAQSAIPWLDELGGS